VKAGVRGLTVAVLALGGAACDVLLTDPAPARIEASVSFDLGATDSNGVARAFARVNRVYLVFARPGGGQRDTILPVLNANGVAKTRLVLESGDRVQALGIFAQLRENSTPLFQGERTLAVQGGTAPTAEVPVAPIAAVIRGTPRQPVLGAVGDTIRLGSTVLFASNDTLATDVGQWTSLAADVVFVTPGGLAVARRSGQAPLVVRYEELADTIQVRVPAG